MICFLSTKDSLAPHIWLRYGYCLRYYIRYGEGVYSLLGKNQGLIKFFERFLGVLIVGDRF